MNGYTFIDFATYARRTPKPHDRRQQQNEVDARPHEVGPPTGCQASPDCLTCPLPECIYDTIDAEANVGAAVAQRFRALTVGPRNREIRELRRQGYTTQQLIDRFGLSYRTIKRVADG